MKTNVHQLWLMSLKKRFLKIPCSLPLPVLRPEKVSVLGSKGSKRREGGKILSCPIKAGTTSILSLVQKLSFSFLWPTFHSCLFLLLTRPWIPQINLRRVPGWICLWGALAKFMVALGMGNRAQTKILRSYFLFPSPPSPSSPIISTFACMD